MDRQKLGTFVLGGVAGAVAGAVAGILAAPRSGRETRGSILNRASETRERGRESYFEARERAQERRSDRGGPFSRGGEPPEMTLGETPEEEASPQEPSPQDISPQEPAPEEAPQPEARLRAVPPEESAVSPEEREELRRRVERTRQRLRGRGSPEDR